MVDGKQTWEACRQLCKEDGNCAAWSWTKTAQSNGAPAKRCHLKDMSKVLKVISKDGVVSGVKGECCAMKGIDFFGNDGDMQENVSSWQQCGASCEPAAGCKAWSWTREAVGAAPKHKCHHKTKAITEMKLSKTAEVISGDKNCKSDIINIDIDDETTGGDVFTVDRAMEQCRTIQLKEECQRRGCVWQRMRYRRVMYFWRCRAY